jgi:hypothetical protein
MITILQFKLIQKLRKILFATICILAVQNAVSQDINIKASFDSIGILIGDQIFFNIITEQPIGANISFPAFTDSIVDKIEVISAIPPDTLYLTPQKIQISRKYLITSFDSGDYKIDFIKFPYTINGYNDTAYSNALMFYVRALPITEPDKIADIKPVIDMPYTFREIATYVLAGLGILLIIALIVYIIVRWRQKKPIFNFPVKPVEPPHIIAFRMLEQLRNEKLWQQGLYKQYYSGLTDILREYIEKRLKVPAMESTTDEILFDIKDNSLINNKLKEELRNMLTAADLVKFAKAEPMPNENENAWTFVYEFVSQTYSDPEPPKNENNIEEANR